MGNLSFKLQKIFVIIFKKFTHPTSIHFQTQFFPVTYTYLIYFGTYKTIYIRPTSTQLFKADFKLCSWPVANSMLIIYNSNSK